MYAIVNHLSLRVPLDQALLDKIEGELIPKAQACPGFRDFYLVRVTDDHAIMVVLWESLAALEAGTQHVAAPWFGEHVAPYLAGPPQRSVGEVVTSGHRPGAAR